MSSKKYTARENITMVAYSVAALGIVAWFSLGLMDLIIYMFNSGGLGPKILSVTGGVAYALLLVSGLLWLAEDEDTEKAPKLPQDVPLWLIGVILNWSKAEQLRAVELWRKNPAFWNESRIRADKRVNRYRK